MKNKTQRRIIVSAWMVTKLAFIGVIAGAVLYVSVDARNTRDNVIYSKGIVKGLNSCKNQTLKTSMPSGAIEQMETWLIE